MTSPAKSPPPVTDVDIKCHRPCHPVTLTKLSADHTRLACLHIETFNKFFDQVYASAEDQFLTDLGHVIGDGEPNRLGREIPAFYKRHGFDVAKMNWNTPYQMGQTGAFFNIRLAGGVYRFGQNHLGLFELFVNSCWKTIYVDGQLAEHLKFDRGVVSFTIKTGRSFQVRFHCAQILGEGDMHGTFEGKTWLPGEDTSKRTQVGGLKYYPFGDAGQRGRRNNHKTSPPIQSGVLDKTILDAVTTRQEAAGRCLSVGFDLITTQSFSPAGGEFFVNPTGFVAEGCNFTAGVVGATVTLTNPGPVGRMTKAAGKAVAQTFGFALSTIESLFVDQLKDFILAFESRESGQRVREIAEKAVNGLDAKELDKDGDRTPTDEVVKTVREAVMRHYELTLKAEIRAAVKHKFPWARKMYSTSFQTAASEACKQKCTQDLSEFAVNRIIRDLVLNNIAARDKPRLSSEITRQKRQIQAKRDEMDEEIKKLPHVDDDAARQRKEQAVKDKYQEEIEKIEKQVKKAEETMDMADRGKLKERLERKERDLDNAVKESTRLERERQRVGVLSTSGRHK